MFKKIIQWFKDLFEMRPDVAEKAKTPVKQEPIKVERPIEVVTTKTNTYHRQAERRTDRPIVTAQQTVYEYRGDDRRNDSSLTDAIATGVIAGVTSAIVEEVIENYNDNQTHYVEPTNIVEETVYQEPVVEQPTSISFVGFDSSKVDEDSVYTTKTYESEPTSSYDSDNDSGWGGGSDSGD